MLFSFPQLQLDVCDIPGYEGFFMSYVKLTVSDSQSSPYAGLDALSII